MTTVWRSWTRWSPAFLVSVNHSYLLYLNEPDFWLISGLCLNEQAKDMAIIWSSLKINWRLFSLLRNSFILVVENASRWWEDGKVFLASSMNFWLNWPMFLNGLKNINYLLVAVELWGLWLWQKLTSLSLNRIYLLVAFPNSRLMVLNMAPRILEG